jgi:thiamine biosynthesis lipoprotein ApbE
MATELNNHHRDTVEKIFRHPASSNVEWRQVLSLLEAVGTVDEKHDGKFEVTLGPETETLRAPHGKDVDVQMVVDLRRMLTEAGYAPDGAPAVSDQESRDHGDGQWGEPK